MKRPRRVCRSTPTRPNPRRSSGVKAPRFGLTYSSTSARQLLANANGASTLRAVPGSSDSGPGGCCQAAQHEADHRETNEGSRLSGVALVVACKPTAATDPRQGSFHNPSFREHHEAMPVTAADDLEHPRAGPRDSSGHLLALIARVSDDAFEKGEAPSRLPQQSLGPIPVLHAGGLHADGQEKTERVGQDVALAAQHLLARVIAGRVERGPPLTPPLTLWLSMTAVVGLGSRPAFSRTSTYRA